MSAVNSPRPTPIGQGPITLPDEISPTVYLKQFVDWLNVKPRDDGFISEARTVRLRLVWLHAPAADSQGVVSYSEIGSEGQANAVSTMSLGVSPAMNVFLKGTAALYSSQHRWGDASPGELSGLPFPFNPSKASEVAVTIWTQTGQIDLAFADGIIWTVQPKFEAGANLLSGFPSGAGAPSNKPLVLLSLSKHGV
jgi:hypothetical protein